jgi:hypothetical protein
MKYRRDGYQGRHTKDAIQHAGHLFHKVDEGAEKLWTPCERVGFVIVQYSS